MAQVQSEHLVDGFLFKGSQSFTIWPIKLGETHVFSVYPLRGVLPAEFRVKNLRYQRFDENGQSKWRINFEVENLYGNGVAYALYWTRILP